MDKRDRGKVKKLGLVVFSLLVSILFGILLAIPTRESSVSMSFPSMPSWWVWLGFSLGGILFLWMAAYTVFSAIEVFGKPQAEMEAGSASKKGALNRLRSIGQNESLVLVLGTITIILMYILIPIFFLGLIWKWVGTPQAKEILGSGIYTLGSYLSQTWSSSVQPILREWWPVVVAAALVLLFLVSRFRKRKPRKDFLQLREERAERERKQEAVRRAARQVEEHRQRVAEIPVALRYLQSAIQESTERGITANEAIVGKLDEVQEVMTAQPTPASIVSESSPPMPPAIEAFLVNSKRRYMRQLLKLLGTPKTYDQIAEELKVSPRAISTAVRDFCITAGVYPGADDARDLREIARNKVKELGIIDD